VAINLTLAAVSLALALVAAELTLGWLARHARGGKEQLERSRYTEYDPILSWRKTPGAHVVYDRREYHVEYTVNRHGLRGPDRPYAKPAGTRRVLALGDSFVEAFMVDDTQTVTARLEDDLGRRGCGAEVINGGTVGYSTDQEYLFYREEGWRYQADVVVLFLYHNDIPYLVLDEYLGYPKPLLDFSRQPPSVANQPVPRFVPAPAPVVSPPPFHGSYLVEFVKNGIESTSARTYDRLAGLGLWEPLRKLPMNEEMNLFHVPELGHLRPAWSALTWTLETLDKAASDAGARLVVAYIPSRMEVDDRVWELTQVRYDLDSAFERGAVAARVAYITERLRVPLLDLTEPLRHANGFFSPTFYKTDSHWNAHGQDVAAAALSEFLVGRGLLSGCD